jgi:cell division protein ZapD
MMLFEFPLHERTRLFLRLESTFLRFRQLASVPEKANHHAAMMVLFELLDMVVGRSDLKSELLQELEKQRTSLAQYQTVKGVDLEALSQVLAELDAAYKSLVAWAQRPGQALRDNEWLGAIKARSGISGGMCEFDLPNYYNWLNLSAQVRYTQLMVWLESFGVLESCLMLSLKILRGSSAAVDVMAIRGQLQQDARAKPFQLIRVWVAPEHHAVPEISASRHVVWVRMMQASIELKSNPAEFDVPLKVALCAL